MEYKTQQGFEVCGPGIYANMAKQHLAIMLRSNVISCQQKEIQPQV